MLEHPPTTRTVRKELAPLWPQHRHRRRPCRQQCRRPRRHRRSRRQSHPLLRRRPQRNALRRTHTAQRARRPQRRVWAWGWGCCCKTHPSPRRLPRSRGLLERSRALRLSKTSSTATIYSKRAALGLPTSTSGDGAGLILRRRNRLVCRRRLPGTQPLALLVATAQLMGAAAVQVVVAHPQATLSRLRRGDAPKLPTPSEAQTGLFC